MVSRLRLLLIAAFCSLHCRESLPVYSAPSNILAFRVSTVEQLSDRISPPERQEVRMVFTCENTFDEVYYDSVDIKGTVRIWWKRKPARFRTMVLAEKDLRERSLLNHGKLLLLPGQKISFEMVWNSRSDDSLYLPAEMHFTFLRQRMCAYNIACSDPERFVVEASLNLYDRLGYVSAPPLEFTYIGRTCMECGVGPVCPPPPGGCIGAADPKNRFDPDTAVAR